MRPIDLFIEYAVTRDYSVTLDPSGSKFANPKTQEAFLVWIAGFVSGLNADVIAHQSLVNNPNFIDTYVAQTKPTP